VPTTSDILQGMPPEELDSLMKDLSDWCKGIRGRQKVVAEVVGVSEQTLSNWISGRKRPGLANYLKIKAFLREQQK
jgi:transcriptional regulator with XRE-family HTH domain